MRLFGILFIVFLFSSVCHCFSLVRPGIIVDSVTVLPGAAEYVGFPHSAYKNTSLSIKFECDHNHTKNFDFTVQFTLRSSPCDKEFFSLGPNTKNLNRTLRAYYEDKSNTFKTGFYYYNSKKYTLKCQEVHWLMPQEKIVEFEWVPAVVSTTVSTVVVSTTDSAVRVKSKRATAEKETAKTDSSYLKTPVDAIYFLVFKIEALPTNQPSQSANVSIRLEWKSQHGYLSAIDYPLLPFYGVMCVIYAIYALVWTVVSAYQWKDLLRIQFWIGAVILLGMVEKAVFYSEYMTVNSTGVSVEGAIQLAELVSCLKRTLSRMLIIIVSVGFGVVKPRLGSTLHQVVGVGFVYFILCSIEAIMRVSKNATEAAKQKGLANLPLVLLDVAIFWWIFTSLMSTMRALRLRRNESKLSLYRHFTNTLALAALASCAFMIWTLTQHTFTQCLIDWTEIWVDTAFWHVLFSVILLVIMVLWRPTNNNQRYAFTPLLDHSEDEDDDDDTLFNSDAFVTADAMKLRMQKPNDTTATNRRQPTVDDADATLEDELKWVEQHIPTTLTDRILAESDEEIEQKKLEVSKML